ncbi:MAG: hypothetical protein ACFE0I_21300 [Elainellaceae cyanobacterium]
MIMIIGAIAFILRTLTIVMFTRSYETSSYSCNHLWIQDEVSKA